jgi:hypothetical protein
MGKSVGSSDPSSALREQEGLESWQTPEFMVSIQDLVVHDCTFCHRSSFDLNHLCTLKSTLHPVYDISANLKNHPSCLRSTQEVRGLRAFELSSKARIWRHLTSLYHRVVDSVSLMTGWVHTMERWNIECHPSLQVHWLCKTDFGNQ